MKLKLYSVKDKLMNFTGPLMFLNEDVAKRYFESECKRKKAQEYTESKYFDLYEIGEFDTEKGIITGYSEAQLKLIKEGEQFDEH